MDPNLIDSSQLRDLANKKEQDAKKIMEEVSLLRELADQKEQNPAKQGWLKSDIYCFYNSEFTLNNLSRKVFSFEEKEGVIDSFEESFILISKKGTKFVRNFGENGQELWYEEIASGNAMGALNKEWAEKYLTFENPNKSPKVFPSRSFFNVDNFSKITKQQWEQYAGKVLAIDTQNDVIITFADTEEEVEIELSKIAAAIQPVKLPNPIEFFHVPKEKSLKFEEIKKEAGRYRNPIRPRKIID
ncbi:MAG: hypothetical protein EKK64_06900 [Neisseriaceae bacterium]|nr:MAG: hypothetical protein EKK64_06900 [Neisseriaceae bacterium]